MQGLLKTINKNKFSIKKNKAKISKENKLEFSNIIKTISLYKKKIKLAKIATKIIESKDEILQIPQYVRNKTEEYREYRIDVLSNIMLFIAFSLAGVFTFINSLLYER